MGTMTCSSTTWIAGPVRSAWTHTTSRNPWRRYRHPALAQGTAAELLNVFGAKAGTRETLDAFDFLRQLAARYSEDLEVAASAADVRRIHAAGRIAIIPTMEGATRLENSPAMLRTLHRLGLRAVTLAFKTNDLADAAGDAPRHGGLSALGAEMVREMNRVGVLVDLSHVTRETMDDVLDIATAPVIFSHSSARAWRTWNATCRMVLRRLRITAGS